MRRVAGKVAEGKKMGPATVLTAAEEMKLEEWLIAVARKGFPVHRSILLDTVNKCLDDKERDTIFKDNRPGKTWWESFKRRHPRIVEKEAESLTKLRASVTKASIQKWFEEVKTLLIEEGALEMLNDSSRIFNADETGFLLCPKTGKVICEKGDKIDPYRITPNNEKEQLTVMASFSADGISVAPMIVFPYKQLPRDVGLSVPKNWAIGLSKSGWMNGDVFFEWVANHFIPSIEEMQIQFPVVLFVDGHKSHLTMHASELCEAKKFILVALHPKCTHILQPADVSVFRPLKAGWREAVRKWRFQNYPQDVTKLTFAPLIDSVFAKRATPIIIQNGFKACGLYPFTSSAVDYSKCVTTRDIPVGKALPKIDNQALKKQTHLESHISENTLKAFRETGDTWNGDEKSLDLFIVWKKFLSESVNEPMCQQHSMPPTCEDQEHSNSPIDEPQETHHLTTALDDGERSNMPSVSGVPSTIQGSESTYTPKKQLEAGQELEATSSKCSVDKYRCENNVATPFKKYLMIPKSPEKRPDGKKQENG